MLLNICPILLCKKTEVNKRYHWPCEITSYHPSAPASIQLPEKTLKKSVYRKTNIFMPIISILHIGSLPAFTALQKLCHLPCPVLPFIPLPCNTGPGCHANIPSNGCRSAIKPSSAASYTITCPLPGTIRQKHS